jgi:hypothetical protein
MHETKYCVPNLLLHFAFGVLLHFAFGNFLGNQPPNTQMQQLNKSDFSTQS